MSAILERTFTVAPLSPVLGASITGLDLRDPLPETTKRAVYDAFVEYHVLCFRDQHLDHEQQIAFTRRFGELMVHPFGPSHPDHREIMPKASVAVHSRRRERQRCRRQPAVGRFRAPARVQAADAGEVASAASGRTIVTVVPWPGWLSTFTTPLLNRLVSGTTS